ncbi:hypothetical protein WEI85_05860 [Actinomycetes bacterium KLBMP 9797]
MTEEILAKLRRLQQQTQGLRELFENLRAHAPAGADGHDPTRSVHVLIGGDGLPTEIRVAPGWQNQLAPNNIGQAVLDASAAAVTAGMQAWSHALDQMRWASRVAEFEARSEPARAGHEPSFPPPDTVGSGAAREPHEVAEDVLRAAEQLRRSTAAGAAAAGTGTDQSGNVAITLTHAGLQACSIQAAWASRQDGNALAAALNLALRTARAQLDAHAKQPEPDAFSHLADQALSTLLRITQTTRGDER